jgi:hypothetical protein
MPTAERRAADQPALVVSGRRGVFAREIGYVCALLDRHDSII